MVKKTKKEMEKIIFDAFIKIEPNFAGGPVTCEQCEKDPPDFICENNQGRIGVELGEWLHKDQTTKSRAFEDIEREIKEKVLSEATISDFMKNHDISIFHIENKFPSKLNKANFITSLIDFLNKFINTSQLNRKESFINEFNGYPKLKEFITGIEIYESRVPGVIEFSKGRDCSPDDAVDALLIIINDKINKNNYQNLKAKLGLSELDLIIYYNKALIYNSPLNGVEQNIHTIVESLRKKMAKSAPSVRPPNYGPFDKIFLFRALEPRMQVFSL
jgi:hypothetical protein